MLGYSNPNKAVLDHCKYLTKRDVPHPQNKYKKIEMNFIPTTLGNRIMRAETVPLFILSVINYEFME